MRPAMPLALAAALFSLSWITASLAPVRATAQEAIPTAADALDGGAPAADAATDTLRLSDHTDRGPEFLRPAGPCGGPAKTEDGKTDKSPHGEVYAGVGTHGYREAGGVVCVPMGDHSAVTIAVDAGQINGWGGRR